MPLAEVLFSKQYTSASWTASNANVKADIYNTLKTYAIRAGFIVNEVAYGASNIFTITAATAFPISEDTPQYFFRKDPSTVIEGGTYTGNNVVAAYDNSNETNGFLQKKTLADGAAQSGSITVRGYFNGITNVVWVHLIKNGTPSCLYMAPIARVSEDNGTSQICRYGSIATFYAGTPNFIGLLWYRSASGGAASAKINGNGAQVATLVASTNTLYSPMSGGNVTKCAAPAIVVPYASTVTPAYTMAFLAGQFGGMLLGSGGESWSTSFFYLGRYLPVPVKTSSSSYLLIEYPVNILEVLTAM